MEEKEPIHVIVEYVLTSSNHTGLHMLIQALACFSLLSKNIVIGLGSGLVVEHEVSGRHSAGFSILYIQSLKKSF